ncbi:MAG: 16S rRNA (guanine(527)-N(7))-methyltransferase RsmG [Planctomycetota bacterium]
MTSPDDPFDGLAERADRIGVELDGGQVDLLRRHFDLLVERNRHVNLTRVTDPGEAVRKLYLSSLALFPVLADIGVAVQGLFSALDLGTGAGFPGIPVAVAAPNLEMTLIDARAKKVRFLEDAIGALDLAGRVTARHVRGGDFVEGRGRFHLVTARAVTTAAGTVAEAAGLLTPGGFLVIQKGEKLTAEEIAEGDRAADRYGMMSIGTFDQPVEDLTPRIMVYRNLNAADAGEVRS